MHWLWLIPAFGIGYLVGAGLMLFLNLRAIASEND